MHIKLFFLFVAASSCAQASQKISVLVVGSGGREHALVTKLLESPILNKLYVAPGNGGTQRERRVFNVPILATDVEALANFAQDNNINLTIVGPEASLAVGIVDEFTQRGLLCLGPTQAAAQLETSKSYAKHFMKRHHIPTARYTVITSNEQFAEYVHQNKPPYVIKADGLAAGKGVVITQDKQEAVHTVAHMLSGEAFGKAGATIVCEEFITGTEVSFIVLTDGKNIIPLASTQDCKPRDNGDRGLNTGGMGGISPAPCMTPALHTRIMKDIIEPTIAGMAADGVPFVGFLYAGLMITPEGDPKVLEFNCRLGDPETQHIMVRMIDDFLPLCKAAAERNLITKEIAWHDEKSLSVVISDGDYPIRSTAGQQIEIVPSTVSDLWLFHAGTKLENNKLVTNGGRVLVVTTLGKTYADAHAKAYDYIKNISFDRMHYRTDIGIMN